MNVHDYLIDPATFDWATLLCPWGKLLPAAVEVWLVNRFGDPFLVFDDGSVNRLDLELGKVERLAADRDQFCDRVDQGDHARDWLLVPLVDAMVECGVTLDPGRCYHLKIPAVVGGKWEVENVGTVPLAERIDFLADFHRQIEHLPDGSRVKLKVTD